MSSPKKKKQTATTKSASPIHRIWSEDDELALLKGLVDFGGNKIDKIEWDPFYNSLQGTLHGHFSKDQVVSKVQKLKKKFTRLSIDSTHPLFPYANLLWGANPAASEQEKDPVQDANGHPVPLPHARPSTENATDSLPPAALEEDLLDAFHTLLSNGLTDYEKKLQLQRLLNIGTRKRKDLGDEWRALCAEEARFNLKKLRFTLKLAEAATD